MITDPGKQCTGQVLPALVDALAAGAPSGKSWRCSPTGKTLSAPTPPSREDHPTRSTSGGPPPTADHASSPDRGGLPMPAARDRQGPSRRCSSRARAPLPWRTGAPSRRHIDLRGLTLGFCGGVATAVAVCLLLPCTASDEQPQPTYPRSTRLRCIGSARRPPLQRRSLRVAATQHRWHPARPRQRPLTAIQNHRPAFTGSRMAGSARSPMNRTVAALGQRVRCTDQVVVTVGQGGAARVSTYCTVGSSFARHTPEETPSRRAAAAGRR